jgi:hypothetical protein
MATYRYWIHYQELQTGRHNAEAVNLTYELNTAENIKRAEESIEASDSMQVPVRILSWKRLD